MPAGMHIYDFEAVRMRARYGLKKGRDKIYLPLYGEVLVMTETLCRMGQMNRQTFDYLLLLKTKGARFSFRDKVLTWEILSRLCWDPILNQQNSIKLRRLKNVLNSHKCNHKFLEKLL